MDKEIFRQEKITPEEFGFDPDASHQTKKMPAVFSAPQETSGFKISGKIPPHIQKELSNAVQNAPVEQPMSRSSFAANAAPGTDDKFNQIISMLTEKAGHYYEIKLPSLGKFYTNGEGPPNGILHIRAMTGREEQILTTTKFTKEGKALSMIYKRCLQENYDPDNFLSEDINYILIFLRGISHTTDYDVEVKCPECAKKFTTQLNLNSLNYEECPTDFDVKSLTGTLPNTGLKFTYRLSTGKDDIEAIKYKDKKVGEWGDTASDDTVLYKMALLVTEIEEITNKNAIKEIISRLPIGDINYLRNVITEPPFGVDTTTKILCPMCSEGFELEMPLELSFFFPRLKKKT